MSMIALSSFDTGSMQALFRKKNSLHAVSGRIAAADRGYASKKTDNTSPFAE